MFNFEQMAFLHRHEDQWREMREVQHHPPFEDDELERRMLRGEKLYRCADCDIEVVAVPPEDR